MNKQMKETEITVELLEPIDSAIEKIKKQGFQITDKIDMHDLYFSKFTTEELLNFSYSELIKNSFLVRQLACNEEVITQLLYKDKIIDSNNNVIAEEKIESNITDLDNAIKIFKLANLNCWCNLEQKMYVMSNDSISFVIQEATDLGTFIEYEEDEDIQNLNEYDKIITLLNRLKDLGLIIGNDYSCKKPLLKFKKTTNFS